MSDNVNKEVFEHNMKTIHKSLDRLTDLSEKLFEKQDEMNTVLTKNTVVVKQHHARSNRFEDVVEKITEQFIKMNKEFAEMVATTALKLKKIDDDIKPIKAHVSEIDKTVGFLNRLPGLLKVILTVLMIASSSIGLFTIGKSLMIKPEKSISKEIK